MIASSVDGLKSGVDVPPLRKSTVPQLLAFVVCFIPFGVYGADANTNSRESNPGGQCFPAVGYLMVGQSAFFHPESRKFKYEGPLLGDANCDEPLSSGTLFIEPDKIVEFDQSNPECTRWFQKAFEEAQTYLTNLAKIRCWYMYGRRLKRASMFMPDVQSHVVNSIDGAIHDAVPNNLRKLDNILKDIDFGFSTYFGMDGWNAEYGSKIYERIEFFYSDMSLE